MRDYTCSCEKGAPIAQLGGRQTLDSKSAVLFGPGFDPHPGRCCLVAGSTLIRGGVVSMRRTLHRYCLVLVKPRKPSQND